MHLQAIEDSLKLFHEAKEELGIELKCLDIGGGFPINYSDINKEIDIYEFCSPLREALRAFPDDVLI